MMMKRRIIAALLGLLLVAPALPAAAAAGAALAPFGAGLRVPARQVKPAKVTPVAVDPLSQENAARWVVELPRAGQEAKTFSIRQEGGAGVLRIATDFCDPARTTVRILLPGDGPANGNVWAKSLANYVTFQCQSNKPAQMSFHLLIRGRTAGTYQAGFAAKPGEWQRVILPVTEFKLKGFNNVAGVGVRLASADKGAEVSIKDIRVGGTPFSDAAWISHQFKISLNGDWRFAPDAGGQGEKEKWFADKFDDSQWQTLKSGLGWQQQGVEHYGWGWYRQQIFVPKEYEGLPLTLTLCPIPADDEVWFNGQRVGGFSSEYKYKNWLTRAYTVPAAALRYGAENTIAIRIWGGNITFIGNNSGLIKGPLAAELDPYLPQMRAPGGQAVPFQLFDLSEAQRGQPFEVLFPFPAEVASEPGSKLNYRFSDMLGNEITAGKAPLVAGAAAGVVQAVVPVDQATAQTIYFRGRFRASLIVEDASGTPLYSGTRELDQLSFAKRDATPLPALAETLEDTPYGKLKLVDEIDCATPLLAEPHPWLQGGFNQLTNYMTPGADVEVKVTDILGKKARESGYGWFAYRIGRGKLKPRSTYLVRIEYPEDKPRFAPVEVQTGQNFMDVGWRNGTAPESPYDNWPLSQKWQWYDVVVPLDDQTVGTGGTGTAPAENGLWLYFMNKQKPNAYYAMWQGGPAVARIKLYEIDPEKNAPVIRKPQGLPQRVLSFDWERQPDHDPADFVKYAKLMGYSAISPVILKWFFANYGEPLNGYESVAIDDHDYWARKAYDPASGKAAEPPIPGRKSQHLRYLEATKRYGIDYIPRVEWGGSMDLPVEARAIAADGNPAKPNRFAPWCANLLHPATWDDLQKFADHLVKPYVQDNPQLTGVLWRIRCDRMPISYGKADLELFAKETNTKLPPGRTEQWAAWAAGEGKAQYDAWWHQKRADFHARLVELLKGYRSDLTLYYYNWDGDKFGLILPANTTWAFNKGLLNPGPGGARGVYEKDEAERKTFTAAAYIESLRTGNFGLASGGINRADYGLRPGLYKDTKGIQLFAPANYLCYADKPEYLNYFQTADGLAVSNAVPYDEIGARAINPKYEGNMVTPGGAPFSMALELLPYFHGDARTLNWTVYTYGRGFADAHRRFAQAFLAIPAIPGTVVDQGDADLKVRTYASDKGTYVGVAYKGYAGKKFTVKIPAKAGVKVTDLVTGEPVPAKAAGDTLAFEVDSGPMELNAYHVQ
jgi:hypothetical protein